MTLRRELLDAVVELAGQVGYRGLTLQLVLDRVGIGNRAFHREFDDVDAAFDAAYERIADDLCDELLAVGGAAEDWCSGFRAALDAYLAWVAREPAAARVLLVEHRVAGGRSTATHERVCGRLERALDSARRLAGPATEPPSLTPAFVLGAIEAASTELVIRREAAGAPDLGPSLAYFGVLLYLGAEVAERGPER
jgi:AcrR family transcriptional regulator